MLQEKSLNYDYTTSTKIPINDKKEGKHIIASLLKPVCIGFKWLSLRLCFYILHTQMKWFQSCVSAPDCHAAILFPSSVTLLPTRWQHARKARELPCIRKAFLTCSPTLSLSVIVALWPINFDTDVYAAQKEKGLTRLTGLGSILPVNQQIHTSSL